MTKLSQWLVLAALSSLLMGCATTVSIERDPSGAISVSGFQVCRGAKYRIVVHQDPDRNCAADGEAADNNSVQFKSECKGFDFKQPVDIYVIVVSVPEDCPNALRHVTHTQAKGVTLTPAGSDKWSIPASKFE